MNHIHRCMLYGISIVFCILTSTAFGHGEDKPGPHGGFIRMPGAFHTEVIPVKNGFNIMLLDINFAHPTNKDSSLKATLVVDKKNMVLPCKTQSDYFFCPVATHLLSQKGELQLLPNRNHAQGALVTYPLPLAKS